MSAGVRDALLGFVAAAALGAGLAGCGGDGLAAGARSDARDVCARYRAEVGPHELGTGYGEMAEQARAYRLARGRLAAGLRRVGSEDGDRAALRSFAAMLSTGNALLVAAEREARSQSRVRQPADHRALVRSLRAFEREASREADAASALGIADCLGR